MNEKTRRPTMQDVADLVGTSKMTISRYLRAPELVAPATAIRIAKVMSQLGYVPSRVPEMLANDRSRAIGVLLPSMSNQVFSAVAQGIEEITVPAGYHVLYGHYGYDAEREAQQVAQLLSFHIDGLMLSESQHTERTLKMLAAADIPVVEMMDLPASPIDQAVGLDHTAAAAAMVNTMIQRGKRHIVYLAARLDQRTQMREIGYRQAMNAAGLECKVIHTNVSSTFSLGGQLLAQAQQQIPQLDGIFCTNDDIAAGALLAAQAQGLRVPDDISIAGVNHLDIGLALQPQLASIVTPRHAIGRCAAERLIARINGEQFTNPVQDLGFELFLGGSI
ncbi:substrate-binding domain-containing protein [Chitinibacter bivalviorum]|uniref:Substrate-binding domain-containing protein n=1 Tax=Chitinibacter bivalviorum TaxID=2739434 RepID=A0A7H9BJU9_9NEIS|nr:substrate-binding domain-containing protein [Chitinibacter bivalviorum]QLG87764.1 substrate-binding domain-containing protein [Chitinibacter bivalviorum]